MKKVLSVLLAAILAMSCAVCVRGANSEIEEFIDSYRPLRELTLNKTEDVVSSEHDDEQDIVIFSFIPKANGEYYFYSDNVNGWFAQGYLVGPDYEIMDESYGFNVAGDLQAGMTYYLIVDFIWSGIQHFTIKATDTQPPPYEIRNSRIEVKFGVRNHVFFLDMLRCNDYEQTHLLVDGEKRPYISGYYWLEGRIPNMTWPVHFTTLDGKSIGTVTLVCKATFWEWINYYLFFGWFRMLSKPLEVEWYNFATATEGAPDRAANEIGVNAYAVYDRALR